MYPVQNSEINAREYFHIRNISMHKNIKNLLFYKLTALNAMICRSGVPTLEITLLLDGQSYSFSGKEVTPELIEIIEAVSDAGKAEPSSMPQRLSLTLDYCLNDVQDFYFNQASPRSTLDFFGENEEQISDDVFYYTFIETDHSGSAGVFSAYGNLDGKEYHGPVRFRDLDSYPDCNHWYAPYAAISCNLEDNERTFPEKDLRLIQQCCEKMAAFSSSSKLDIKEGVFSLVLTHLVLRSSETLLEFTGLIEVLCTLIEGCRVDIEFLELSADVPLVFKMSAERKRIAFSEKYIEGLSTFR